jgi:NADH-quinone oxidoreductase subunit C
MGVGGRAGEALLPRLQALFGDRIVVAHGDHGDETIVVRREDLLDICRQLRERPELAFDLLADQTAVDYLGETPRFELVCHLCSLSRGHRLRVKVRLPEEDPVVPSLVPIWQAANWMEREVWDMFGIRFAGHPDLRRILMYEEFVGHPLRKDYPVDKRQPLISERDPIEQDWKFDG